LYTGKHEKALETGPLVRKLLICLIVDAGTVAGLTGTSVRSAVQKIGRNVSIFKELHKVYHILRI
jgi:hypothetical protein